MMKLLEGKCGIIIGASSGIGAATARLLAHEGAKLIIAARRSDKLNAVISSIEKDGGQAKPFVMDVLNPHDHDSVVGEAINTYGTIDFAFNNAGTIGNFVPLLDQSIEDWDKTIDTNLKSIWLSLKAQTKAMKNHGGGAIVNTSSWLANGALIGSTSYSASKAGMDGLLRAVALETAEYGIRVNNVNPGGIDTEMTRLAFNHDEAILTSFAKSHPSRRMGTSEEVAQLVSFLLSDRASNITGQCIAVDGGYTIPGQRGNF